MKSTVLRNVAIGYGAKTWISMDIEGFDHAIS